MNNKYPFGSIADALAQHGQGKDNVLIHVEKNQLPTIEKALGHKGKVNPQTGLFGYSEDAGTDSSNDTSDPGSPGGLSSAEVESLTNGPDKAANAGAAPAGAPGGLSQAELNSLNGTNSLRERDERAVDSLGNSTQDVNRASLAFADANPSLGDRIGAHIADFFGSGAPGGFLDSDAALGLAGVAGSLLAGPIGGALATAFAGAAQGRSIGSIAGQVAQAGLGPVGGFIGDQALSALGIDAKSLGLEKSISALAGQKEAPAGSISGNRTNTLEAAGPNVDQPNGVQNQTASASPAKGGAQATQPQVPPVNINSVAIPVLSPLPSIALPNLSQSMPQQTAQARLPGIGTL